MEIFVILHISAKGDGFAGLAEQLGQQLEFTSSLKRGREGDELRMNATLTYLATRKLEKVVNIFRMEGMSEEEHSLLQVQDSVSDMASISLSCYSGHML